MSNNQSFEFTTPVGRLVGGHPMNQRVVRDDRTNQPKLQQDGVTPRTEAYCGVAIPKGQETHWNQTEWGALIDQAAKAGWPNGEFGAATFAWKITDGDSPIPNKRGNKPCDREGYPGHWVINMSSGLDIKCYHAGKYDPTQQIQNQNEIKPGDYCRVLINAVANAPSQSPGVYLNPRLFELSRAGELIVLDSGPSAADAFGGGAPQQQTAAPQPGQQPPIQQTTAPAPQVNQAPAPGQVAPAPDFLQPEVKYLASDGNQYTRAQLEAVGYTEQQIAALPQV